MASLKKNSTKKSTADEEVKAIDTGAEDVTSDVPETDKTEDTGVTISGVNEPSSDTEEGTEPVAPLPPRSVKIKMAVSHRCSIGGVRYNLEKDKTYIVPENVKRVLSSARLLLPL